MPPLMPGPTPKANDQRRRQNATIAMTQLPNEGYTGPVPVWPLSAASPAELVRWAWLWTRPQAAMWVRDGIEDIVARYVRNCIAVEDGSVNVAMAYIVAEIRQQEDRLGRNPMALLRLRWEVAPDHVAEVRDENTRRGARERLRAVDTTAAAQEG